MTKMKTTPNGRRPTMEDYLKLSKVEYLSNPLLDYTQIWNLSLYDQTIFCKSIIWRWPPIEEDLKLSKVEYLSNCLLDHTQILNLDLGDQSKVFKIQLIFTYQQ